MTGLRPSTTGIYGNLAWFRDIPKYKDWETIPQYFRKHGYMAVTGGKIYHQPHGKFSDPMAWDYQYSTQMGTPFPPQANRYRHGMHDLFSNKILARLIDWGPIEQQTEQTGDWKTADKAAQFLQQEHDKPFFLACGVYHPHLPWYVPEKYFDMPNQWSNLADDPECAEVTQGLKAWLPKVNAKHFRPETSTNR